MSPLPVGLADLIAQLEEETSDGDALARISEAQLRADTLSDLGDQLVGYFVGKARRDGASWSQIGEAIGVSKQAAQQRHTPGVFERFTDLNRHSVVLAQEAARTRKHDAIGGEHLLLGLLGEPRGLAFALLVEEAGSEQSAREAVEAAMAPAGRRVPRGHIPLRADAEEALERAVRASRELGQDWVDTEHLLLGLVSARRGSAARILRNLGFTPDQLRERVTSHAVTLRRAGDQKRRPGNPGDQPAAPRRETRRRSR